MVPGSVDVLGRAGRGSASRGRAANAAARGPAWRALAGASVLAVALAMAGPAEAQQRPGAGEGSGASGATSATGATGASGAAPANPGIDATPAVATAPVWATGGAFSPTPGNEVKVYVDGERSYAAIAAAIVKARSYFYATFAYFDLRFIPRPDSDPRTILDLMLDRARHGVDVKIVIWNPNVKTADTLPDPSVPIPGINGGPGTIQARWDRAPNRGVTPFIAHGCNHQKSFVMDSPEGPVAFVGGINASQAYWDTSEHEPFDKRRIPGGPDQGDGKTIPPPLHDLFAKMRGPSVRDVTTNFVQRYNAASSPHRDMTADARVPEEIEAIAPRPDGVDAQIVRTIAKNAYRTIPQDHGIREIYVAAINSARKLIYFENQYFFDDTVIDALQAAARRGVKVIGLITSRPDEGDFVETIMEKHFARQCARLPNVTLSTPGVAWADPAQPDHFKYREIYVHAKVMIVDASFVTLGSANIAFTSMGFHSELNVALNDRPLARDLLQWLWREHLQLGTLDTGIFDDPAAAAALWQQHARTNLDAYHSGQKPMSRVFPFGTTFP